MTWTTGLCLTPSMDATSFVHHLRAEARALAATVSSDTSGLPVPSCPGWDLGKLVRHVGRVHQWALDAITSTAAPGRPVIDPPEDAAALAEWYVGQADRLAHALDVDPATPCWTFDGSGTVGFWQRRQAVEVLLHRWDAEGAVGTPAPLDEALAAEGIDEMVDMMIPRRVGEGAVTDLSPLRLVAGDRSWQVGAGEPAAELSGAAGDLLLVLWGRTDAAACRWSGDAEAGRAVLRQPLAP